MYFKFWTNGRVSQKVRNSKFDKMYPKPSTPRILKFWKKFHKIIEWLLWTIKFSTQLIRDQKGFSFPFEFSLYDSFMFYIFLDKYLFKSHPLTRSAHKIVNDELLCQMMLLIGNLVTFAIYSHIHTNKKENVGPYQSSYISMVNILLIF